MEKSVRMTWWGPKVTETKVLLQRMEEAHGSCFCVSEGKGGAAGELAKWVPTGSSTRWWWQQRQRWSEAVVAQGAAYRAAAVLRRCSGEESTSTA